MTDQPPPWTQPGGTPPAAAPAFTPPGPPPPAPPGPTPYASATPTPYAPVGPTSHSPNEADPADIRPKKRWYLVAGAVLVLGIAAAIAVFVFGLIDISNQIDDFERVSDGTGTIELDEAGEYVVYSEAASSFSRAAITGPDGEPVRSLPYLTGLNYGFNGRSGVAVSTFRAEQAGTYTVTTNGAVAIGPSVGGDLVRTILVPFAVGGVTMFAALVIFLVTAVRRSRSKKRLALS